MEEENKSPEIEVPISNEADFEIDFKGTQIELSLNYSGKGVGGKLAVELEAEYFIKKLCEKIPGKIDDYVAEALLAFLKSQSKE